MGMDTLAGLTFELVVNAVPGRALSHRELIAKYTLIAGAALAAVYLSFYVAGYEIKWHMVISGEYQTKL
jgi:branched-subunit amino acid permease